MIAILDFPDMVTVSPPYDPPDTIITFPKTACVIPVWISVILSFTYIVPDVSIFETIDASADDLVLISVESALDKDTSALDKETSADDLVLSSVESALDKDTSADYLVLISLERALDKSFPQYVELPLPPL